VKTLALVESPAQLLNVLEWTHQSGADPSELSTAVLAPRSEMSRLQLSALTEVARTVGHTVQWHELRHGGVSTARTVASLATQLPAVHRLIIGDPFSGAIQLLLTLSRASEVVVVDDGTATIEFARLLTAGKDLVRWHSTSSSGHRRRIAALASRRMGPGSGCRLSLFTCMPVHLVDVPILRNDFSWVRGFYPTPRVKVDADLIGTSLVETGVVDLGHYLRGVETLANVHAVDRYFAHRKEDLDKLAQISRLGLRIVRPDLPLEVTARRGPIGQKIISFPSTVVHTLPLVLSDTSAELQVCDIADDWYTRQAPTQCDQFLGQITTTARATHGLLTVAC
jgi:hypothetical protein